MNRTPEPEIMSDDREARAYQAADFSDVDQPYVERLLALLQNRPPRPRRPQINILDLGTGPADIPIRIARLLPNARIVGLDASAAMLALARQKLKRPNGRTIRRSLTLLRADVKCLPFAPATFDAIISNSLLHHVHRPAPFWKEIHRVAKKEAVILVQDLFRPPSCGKARDLVKQHASHESKLLQQLFYQSLLAAFRPSEIRRQLRAAKLSHLSVSTIDDRHLVIEGQLNR